MGMSFYNIFIMPIELFIEFVFSVMNSVCKNPGYAIIFVSIAVQLLCFPLYKRADAIQEQDRQKQKKMKPWLEHIKKTFKGDERFMMQQAYYRIENYKPIYAIKGSISLLLQIPFFIAAYNFLSNLDLLNGTPFFAISDLSQPDRLIHIGAVSINLLPILMTLFNIISGIIYTKGFPLKDKIQTYGLACIFFVILYKSPSGLVFYWTLNNMFSLLKNIFLKLVNKPQKVISAGLFFAGIITAVYSIVSRSFSQKEKMFLLGLAAVCLAVAILMNYKSKFKAFELGPDNPKLVNSIFYFSLLTLSILVGIYIPISAIKTSPTEFISTNYGPFGLIANNFCLSIGLFWVWVNVFFVLSSPKTKKVFSAVLSSVVICCIMNALFFGNDMGTMSAYFVFDKGLAYSLAKIIVNSLIVVALIIVFCLLYHYKSEIIKRVYQITALSLAVVCVFDVVSVRNILSKEGYYKKDKVNYSTDEINPIITLSKGGKNVIVFMLDRAINGYIPFIFEEDPEIKAQFDGFTYYPNTVSFGKSTNFATPSLFGGYEYTPTNINKRADETLAEKQNEALTVLPRLFSENGYNAFVLDPPYAGYHSIPDLSIYDEYSSIKAYNTIGAYSKSEKAEYVEEFESKQKRNTCIYSLMKSLPVVMQTFVYQGGLYRSTDSFIISFSSFLDSYTVLKKLDLLTEISDDTSNNFIMMQNDTPHNPQLLKEPEYELAVKVDIPSDSDRIDGNGNVLHLGGITGIEHYHSNICSLKAVGKWLDYLRENDVYDNTRIIIVSDHGHSLGQFDYMLLDDDLDIQSYNPLLLVKDFNGKGFNTSYEFMTNADTPSIAVNNLIDNPMNPFTGKLIDNSEKYAHPQLITISKNAQLSKNRSDVFDIRDGEWWSVQDNIFDKKNWKKAEAN